MAILIDKIREKYGNQPKKILFIKGFDGAVIGINESEMRLVYSEKKYIAILLLRGMSYSGAIDKFESAAAKHAKIEHAPIFCRDRFFINL